MPGPPPKEQKRRRNKPPSTTLLPARSEIHLRAPTLPERRDGLGWCPEVRDLWVEIWHSPMATQFDVVDLHALLRYMELVQRFWTAELDTRETLSVASELRLQGALFGFTPQDRARLKWDIERGEQADESSARRRATPRKNERDPRLESE